jgi:hypothetical protein
MIEKQEPKSIDSSPHLRNTVADIGSKLMALCAELM